LGAMTQEEKEAVKELIVVIRHVVKFLYDFAYGAAAANNMLDNPEVKKTMTMLKDDFEKLGKVKEVFK
jgi:hypothetical protein